MLMTCCLLFRNKKKNCEKNLCQLPRETDILLIGKSYEFCFLFFGCQYWGAGVDPAIVSLIPSGFVKSSPFFPLAELTNIKGSADAGVEIDQGRIAEDF